MSMNGFFGDNPDYNLVAKGNCLKNRGSPHEKNGFGARKGSVQMKQNVVEQKTAKLYDDLWSDLNHADFEEYTSRLRRILPEELYAGKCCLDAGCGQGAISAILSTSARKLCSVDIGERAIEITRRRLPVSSCDVNVQKASLLALPFPDAFFDLVVSNGVIHHTTDPRLALRELVRVLKPGGTIILGLYGKTGLLRYIIEFGSVTLRWIPYRIMKNMLVLLGTRALLRYYLLDYIYVPIRKRFRVGEAKRMLEDFSDIQIRSDYPKGRMNWIYGRNYFYVIAKKA